MSALECDASAIYEKRKDNLRFFLDNLPTHACHVRPNFNLCTVCFKINTDIAKECEVYKSFNRGMVGSKVHEPVHVDLARSIDLEFPEEPEDIPEELEKEFPMFEFSKPTSSRVNFDEEPDEEIIEADVVEAEVVEDEEEPPKPVVKPAPKVEAPPQEPVKVKRVVKPAANPPAEPKPLPPPPKPEAKPLPPPPTPEEKKAPEAQAPVKVTRRVKMVPKAAPKPGRGAPTAMPPGPPKPATQAGPSPMPAPGPSPLEPRPDLFPPPPGPGPAPSPEPDDDDEDTELIRKEDLEKKAPSKPLPPPPRAEAKPVMGDRPPPPKGGIPPLFATLGKLETKKKPDE